MGLLVSTTPCKHDFARRPTLRSFTLRSTYGERRLSQVPSAKCQVPSAKCQVVLCSNVSSAALDANLQGIPILMFRDGRQFDGSLLKTGPTMHYVNNAKDVNAFLRNPKFVERSRSLEGIYSMYTEGWLTKMKGFTLVNDSFWNGVGLRSWVYTF